MFEWIRERSTRNCLRAEFIKYCYKLDEFEHTVSGFTLHVIDRGTRGADLLIKIIRDNPPRNLSVSSHLSIKEQIKILKLGTILLGERVGKQEANTKLIVKETLAKLEHNNA